MNIEFECKHCRGLNNVNLEDINLSELFDSDIETEKMKHLREQNK